MFDKGLVPFDSSIDPKGGRFELVPQEPLDQVFRNASEGSAADIKRLADRARRAESDMTRLRRQLRKQQLDFTTLFEIVGQTSARSLDLVSMQTYLLRTVSGHFTTPQLLIFRREREEDQCLTKSAAQGVRDVEFQILIDSELGRYAVENPHGFELASLSAELSDTEEVKSLAGKGMQLIVPLVQELEGPEPALEGLLVLGARLANRAYNKSDLEFLNTLGKMLAICLRNEALYRRSIVDDLTGIFSRGHFEARLSQEINRVHTYSHRSLGLVMIDADHFKGFNDTYGHQTGDLVLQKIARVLEKQVRNVDLVARYGGEEFAVVLLEIDRNRAFEVAERLRVAIESIEMNSMDGRPLKVTASFGVGCFPDDADHKTELIQVADRALYRAKAEGRNRTILATQKSGKRMALGDKPEKEDEFRPADRRRQAGICQAESP